MSAIACNEARGDQSSLLNAINEGFDAKLSANQFKKYPIAYKYDGREIVKIGVNISTDGDVRTITEWKVEN